MHNATDSHTPAPLTGGWRALKNLAIVMGVVLVAGFVVMFSFMAKQVGGGASKTCDPTTIEVADNNELIKIEEKEDMLTLWLKDATGAVVLRRYSMCGGKILRDVRVSGGMPPQQVAQPQQLQPQPPKPAPVTQ